MRKNLMAFLGLAILALACDKPAPEYPKRVAKPGQASLPTTPNLDPVLPPDRHPDGAWSVRGLLGADKAKLEGDQQVRGYVASLKPCPLDQKVCTPAPHLYLSDDPKGVGKRLLVGGERDLASRGWKVGDQVTVAGTFTTSSPDGIYFAPTGLLLLTPAVPPGADVGAAK